MLPQTHHQLSLLYGNGLIEAHHPLVASNLGAGSFDQFASQYEHGAAPQEGQVARKRRESSKTANQMIDPFFDESAEELSSIEHSHNGAPSKNFT